MGYTRYLADKHGDIQAYELAAAMLPPDMISFFRRGEEGKDRAKLIIEYVVKYQVTGSLLGPRGEKIVYEMEKHSEDLDVDKKAYYYDAMTRAYERMARLERINNGEIVEFDGLRFDTNYTAKDLDSLLKDPELTGDLTTLMSRVDEKIGSIKEEKDEADRAEKDRPKVEEFKDLYDEEKVVKKVSKNKQWWE
jgi:hypothetical protein